MTKLVNFLRINFALILVCFFLPFFPFFSCEKGDGKPLPSVLDAGNGDTIAGGGIQNGSSLSDTIKVKADSLVNKPNAEVVKNEESATQKILDYLSFTKYKTAESNTSITGFGMLVVALENFKVFEWGNYLMPICFLCCILGLVVSIKSKRRKHLFLFVCSLIGLADIVFIGFLIGNLSELLFGYWVVAILYLVTSLLSFILWRNFFPSYN
jgi:hypothetical protein